MSTNTSIGELRVSELVEAIGAGKPAPGAGAAGAVALALAAACAGKAASISLRHRPQDRELRVACEGFAEIGRRALWGADADAEDFAAFMRSRNSNMADRLVRTDKRLVDLCTALTVLTEQIESSVTQNLVADLFAARKLAAAAREIETRNITETLSDKGRAAR